LETFNNLPVRNPKPDGKYFINYLMGTTKGGRVPLVEYLIDEMVMRPVVTELLGRTWVAEPWPVISATDRAAQSAFLDNFIRFWYYMGYDIVRFERSLGFPSRTLAAPDTAENSTRDRAWSDEHRGMIRNWDDFERYPWPRYENTDFFPYEYLNSHLPDGMGLIVCHAAGMLEHLESLMSYEGLAYAVHDGPDLVQAISDRVGELMTRYYEHLLTLDKVIAIFPGDDMGFRSGTLIAPDHLRRFTLPYHKRFAAMTHARGLPYFLHSCGNLAKIMDDLITEVRIDGKHSFEDAILPVEEFQMIYGDRIAVLGGVDVHRLASDTPKEIRARVRFLIETCGGRGRYAIGSGNSIPSYIPPVNYLSMIDEALDQ
jgi:uroporphyrinogen decarboxylase